MGNWGVTLVTGDSLQYLFDLGEDNTANSGRALLGRNIGASRPYVQYVQAGTGIGDFTDQTSAAWFLELFGDGTPANPPKFTDATVGGGINDVREVHDASAVFALFKTLRQAAAAIFDDYGIPVVQSTLGPIEQIVGFVYGAPTEGGGLPLGPHDQWYATFCAQRILCDNWVISDPVADIPNIRGHWDWNTVWERLVCQWVLIYRNDGLHPNTLGMAAAAGTISALPILAWAGGELIFMTHPDFETTYIGERTFFFDPSPAPTPKRPLKFSTVRNDGATPDAPTTAAIHVRDSGGALVDTITPDLDPDAPAGSLWLTALWTLRPVGNYTAQLTQTMPGDGQVVSDRETLLVR